MESLWQDCLLHFERELPGQQFQTWFKPLALLRIDQNSQSSRVVLAAPTRFKQSWAKNQFSSALSAWWSNHLGTPVELEIKINGQPLQPNQQEPAREPAPEAVATQVEASGLTSRPAAAQNRLNADWTFETFVLGKANQLARAAALQVADNPGKGYNPLFIYGGVGLGKAT